MPKAFFLQYVAGFWGTGADFTKRGRGIQYSSLLRHNIFFPPLPLILRYFCPLSLYTSRISFGGIFQRPPHFPLKNISLPLPLPSFWKEEGERVCRRGWCRQSRKVFRQKWRRKIGWGREEFLAFSVIFLSFSPSFPEKVSLTLSVSRYSVVSFRGWGPSFRFPSC